MVQVLQESQRISADADEETVNKINEIASKVLPGGIAIPEAALVTLAELLASPKTRATVLEGRKETVCEAVVCMVSRGPVASGGQCDD